MLGGSVDDVSDLMNVLYRPDCARCPFPCRAYVVVRVITGGPPYPYPRGPLAHSNAYIVLV